MIKVFFLPLFCKREIIIKYTIMTTNYWTIEKIEERFHKNSLELFKTNCVPSQEKRTKLRKKRKK